LKSFTGLLFTLIQAFYIIRVNNMKSRDGRPLLLGLSKAGIMSPLKAKGNP
jgi:hypothetical protein